MILIKKINHNKIFIQIIMGKNFSNIKVVLGGFGI